MGQPPALGRRILLRPYLGDYSVELLERCVLDFDLPCDSRFGNDPAPCPQAALQPLAVVPVKMELVNAADALDTMLRVVEERRRRA